MSRRQRMVCQCGGELPRPLPAKCPHCGAVLGRVRRSLWSQLYPPLIVAGLFTAVVAFVVWWVRRLT